MDLKNKRIAVIGAGITDEKTYQIAYKVGKLLGEKGAIVYTGGLGGVMEAACKGAVESGAITVGILPGHKPEEANPYVKVLILTDMGHARNVVLIRSVEAVIAVSGGYGTLSEIALALKMWKPVIGLHTWENLSGVYYVSSPEEALAKVLEVFS
ncbi:TIGR00725 family protein [Thermodesulfobacterium sp. TA1]|uniref:TIGR00725 family protein n=1 Tax=Thermodesulfobacterium sp. TA1 TaxID=2234087 RepID=UPI001232DCD6|nr:TIGR00725 family protein [Thermodesulfobacterium sp. TA1]QER42197.1 TIGR00725 family protein [Thermodesulfobacterium sp. TA1]